MLLEPKCFQLDSNLIANDVCENDEFETFFNITKCFHL